MSKMTLYSGLDFDPICPSEKEINIKDIAHALSLLCRGNGQIKYFYSVAQHSINCYLEAKARGYSLKVQLALLLHDASEAYLADLIRPIKGYFPKYYEIEAALQNLIYKKFLISSITEEERLLVKEVDDALLNWELFNLMKGHEKTKYFIKGKLSCEIKNFIDIENEFLKIFQELIFNLN